MKITKQQLIEMSACKAGLRRFIDQTNNTDEPIEVSSLIGGKNTVFDLLWLAGETLSKERIVRFACDCALINIELIKPHTDKYDLIVSFLKDPDACVDSDIGTIARSACATAATARSAVIVTHATHAVRAAHSDIYVITRATAFAAAYAAMNATDKVNNLLIEMFGE